MRTFRIIASYGLLVAALSLSPNPHFDVRPQQRDTMTPPPSGQDANPAPALEIGRETPLAAVPTAPSGSEGAATQALQAGLPQQPISELEYAADQGVPIAQWTLGRMYVDGQGVEKNLLRAFEYFSRLAKSHGDDAPGTKQARLVADAFVSLGQFYLEGVPNSSVKPDPDRARQLFWYAATYFADPEAQYNLARLYLDRDSGARDPRQAVRWLRLAARKGQYKAQALLGALLFEGGDVPRHAALGLFWLTIATDRAGPNESWISETYSRAFARATENERAMAYRYLEDWLRDGDVNAGLENP
jgi:TPR repeat protein